MKCERFDCKNEALDEMTQIAPGTNVRFCQKCKDEEFSMCEQPDDEKDDTEYFDNHAV